MADQWIKMRTDLSTEPAVIAIAGATGLDEDHVVGKLHRLWSWADGQLRDGNAPSVTGSWVDRYLSVPGFADAMQAVGWLIASADGISFPNFDRHMSTTAKKRAQTARRVAQHRRDGNAASVTNALPREEKKREEKKQEARKGARQFAKPSVDDVQSFCEENGITIDAQQFIDHYDANGWKVGRAAMKDWKAAVRNWGRRQNEFRKDAHAKPRYTDGPGQVHPDTPRRF